jgi:uncharacterized protein with PIN domain
MAKASLKSIEKSTYCLNIMIQMRKILINKKKEFLLKKLSRRKSCSMLKHKKFENQIIVVLSFYSFKFEFLPFLK